MPMVLLRVATKSTVTHLTTYAIPADTGSPLPLPLNSFVLTSASNLQCDANGQCWIRQQAIIVTRVSWAPGMQPVLTQGSETACLETAMPVSTIDPATVGLKTTEPFLAYPSDVMAVLKAAVLAKLKKPKVATPKIVKPKP